VKRISSAVLVTLFAVNLGLAEETSFQRVKVPDTQGRQIRAVLTFSDNDKAVEVRPLKGEVVSIPYAQIDKFSYEYTRNHRINDTSMVMAPIGVGVVMMMTKAKNHWLEIDYRDQDVPKTYVVRMDKQNYLRILDAVKSHTGKDAEVLGNADKRRK
jgi:hypothetical protein